MPSDPRPRDIAFDCRHFRGDRPCVWHKRAGLLCECEHYSRVQQRILIIKLDAMGDVLRTTALLPGLAQTCPNAAITWVTRLESVPLLQANPFISEVCPYGPDALLQLSVREFDRVINLDAGTTSAALASLARSTQKEGFVLAPTGVVQPTNDAARQWLEMGIFDDRKRSGRQTYQEVMAEIVGLSGKPHRYVFELRDDELARGRAHLANRGVTFDRPVIGLNTGAGGRWPLKQWRVDGYLQVIERLAGGDGAQFVLLGGPGEVERHQHLKSASAVPLIDAGCDNPVRHFGAIIAHCNLVITGDTLAMHIALALGCRTVVLFGPTSAAEIELYGLGEKVVPDMSCLSCYKTSCDFVPNCMDLITVDMVEQAARRQLAAWNRGR